MTQWAEFDEPGFLQRLRSGDQAAYRTMIRRFHRALTSMAYSVIGSSAQAEEVTQDTWLAFFSAIDRFEGRSSVVTWLFTILMNRARNRASSEKRLVALPDGFDGASGEDRAVPLSAFKPDGHWIEEPRLWDDIDPERVIGGQQLWQHVTAALEALPPAQKSVLILRDIEGQSAEETCALLQISPENQRVLLHRARGRVRQAIDAVTQSGSSRPQPQVAAAARIRPAPSTRPSGAARLITGLMARVRAALSRRGAGGRIGASRAAA
ncbi:MAG TPA: sigma-70 family RNA polymerase sigma factor [Rhodopila sp.]|nr:sigma-70 family RNA polymerase sigma factor [Rhodopila sp.]